MSGRVEGPEPASDEQRRAVGSGRVVLVPTPIGNLEDITLRALAVLREADVVACEDTRHTAGLLARHAIRAARLVSYHEHNEAARARELVALAQAGQTVAVVSDAGTPGVNDPGFAVVAAAQAAGVRVEVLPGASSVIVALVLSGLGGGRFTFTGFLPRKRGELEEVLSDPEVLVAFESPRRLGATLEVLAEQAPERPVAVCRELTKLHEEVVRGTAAELAARYGAEEPRGEVVLVLGGMPAADADLEAAVEALAAVVAAGARARPAAAAIGALTGLRPNALYGQLTARK